MCQNRAPPSGGCPFGSLESKVPSKPTSQKPDGNVSKQAQKTAFGTVSRQRCAVSCPTGVPQRCTALPHFLHGNLRRQSHASIINQSGDISPKSKEFPLNRGHWILSTPEQDKLPLFPLCLRERETQAILRLANFCLGWDVKSRLAMCRQLQCESPRPMTIHTDL